MCGIAAAMPSDTWAVRIALAAMRERGPDQEDVTEVGFATLGVNRLAITDLEDGEQPLISPSGRCAVVFNGAIYNLAELRERYDLQALTGNDGEVIHQLYERFGLDFASYLDGMFAVILADLEHRKLVFAVDSIGIKPLYYSLTGDGVLFIASVLQAFPRMLAPTACRVPPATVWTSRGEAWRTSPRTARQGMIDDLLPDAVQRQVPEEVPWGCLLSGGVDSSTIAALAAREHGRVKTFTCGFADSEDRIAAARVAEFVGSEHREEIIDPEEIPELLETVVKATATPDPAVTWNGIGTFLASRCAARAGIKVLLSGEGADELFGGYDDYVNEPEYLLDARLTHDQNDLGATECLRLDRCTMAHSIEARVPFLSPAMVRHARSLPTAAKLCRDGEEVVRKPVLRRFARSLLPEWAADRPKNPFFRGTGLYDALMRQASERFKWRDVRRLRAEFPRFWIDEDPLAAWIFATWHQHYWYLADSSTDLVSRGLYKRKFSRFQPHCVEPNDYTLPDHPDI